MAIVFMDGFDHWANGMEKRKWDDELVIDRSTINPRTGIGCLLFTTTSEWVTKNFVPALGSVVIGFAMFIDDSLTGDTYDAFVIMRTGMDDQLYLQYSQVDQKFRFRSQDTSVSSVSTNTYDLTTGYHHIEMKATFDNGTPANNTVELRVNETVEIVDTLDTNPQATGEIDVLEMSGLTSDVRYDDLYILNSTSPNNDFLGDVKIQTLHVNADGSLTAWTGSNTDVDDVTPDDNTTNIVSSTNGQQSTFGVDTLAGVGAVKGLQINSATRKDGAGDGDIKILTISGAGATVHKSSTIVVGAHATDHVFLMQQQDVDPETLAAWTVGNINAGEFGVEQIS